MTGCMEWQGALCDGYGRVSIGSRFYLVHRLMFFIENGIWPVIAEHKCDNRKCCLVDTKHVINGSYHSNNKRLPKTHCKRGHELTIENTQINNKNGKRYCKICQHAARKRNKYRVKIIK